MNKKPRKYSRQSLINRLERLKVSHDKENNRISKVADNIGWGAGMRRTKVTPSFSKLDKYKSKISEVETLIAEYDNQQLSIVDIHGKTIKVTNLKEALDQAEMFAGFQPVSGKLNHGIQLYWKDFYKKLKKLAKQYPELLK